MVRLIPKHFTAFLATVRKYLLVIGLSGVLLGKNRPQSVRTKPYPPTLLGLPAVPAGYGESAGFPWYMSLSINLAAAMSIKIPVVLRNPKTYSKMYMEESGPCKANLPLKDFKLFYKTTVTTTKW